MFFNGNQKSRSFVSGTVKPVLRLTLFCLKKTLEIPASAPIPISLYIRISYKHEYLIFKDSFEGKIKTEHVSVLKDANSFSSLLLHFFPLVSPFGKIFYAIRSIMLAQRDSIGISTAIAWLERECWCKRASNKWIVSRYNRDRSAISFILLRFKLHYVTLFQFEAIFKLAENFCSWGEERKGGNGIREQFENSIPNRINCFPFRPMICKYFFIANSFNADCSTSSPSSSQMPPPLLFRRYQTRKILRTSISLK